MIIYCKFSTSYDKCIKSEDCSTRWNNNIKCSIPMSGLYRGKYTNLMIMEGDEKDIKDWVNENIGKVEIITEKDADSIGQIMSPKDVISISNHFGNDIKLKSGLFTIKNGQTWIEVK